MPEGWPPVDYDRAAMEFFRSRLLESGDAVGWYCWYAVDRLGQESGRVVIGAGGYLSPPDRDGVVEIGYSVVLAFRDLGLATELVDGLARRALSAPGVVRLVAHTTPENPESVKVLAKCGFVPVGPGRESGNVRYERSRPIV